MKFATKSCSVVIAASLIVLSTYGIVRSHCEIPCGVYGDSTRIALLYENIETIEKSMTQITELEKSRPLESNQLIRWVSNKEEHANNIQHIATQYFMTQRVKAAHPNYVEQLKSLHGMLVQAMKAKQTTDHAHCKNLRQLVDKFASVYFTPEDLKHIRKEHGHHAK